MFTDKSDIEKKFTRRREVVFLILAGIFPEKIDPRKIPVDQE